jgi:hypothetical protein
MPVIAGTHPLVMFQQGQTEMHDIDVVAQQHTRRGLSQLVSQSRQCAGREAGHAAAG